MARIVGASLEQIDAPAQATLLAHVHADDRTLVEQALDGAMHRGLAYSIEFRIVRSDGVVRRLLEQTEVERLDDDAVTAVHGLRRDITEQTEANERIRSLAFFDPLTGLANRSLFRNMVQHMLSQAAGQTMRCAVLIVDIDRFKVINSLHGPQIGDEVLKIVGLRLRDCLRAADLKGSTRNPPAEERIARLGGDEFTVLLGDITDPHQAIQVAQRIVGALSQPVTTGGIEMAVSASIGISMTPDDGDDADSLIMSASTALHTAKQDALHRIRFYDNAMSEVISQKVSMESELRRAIAQGELRVYYQAKVDVRTSRVVGAEALLRWMHPVRGLTGPMEFIPIAEESGLIIPITQWVIGEVCGQLAAWRADGRCVVPVSINLDASSLHSEQLVESVALALAQNALHASALEFEVTESSLMRDLNLASNTLEALRTIGVKLSIDDFGTGYSSLTYLKRFPVDVLKIDRSFIQDLPADNNDAALTTAIIVMGHSLGLELVAEGVETREQVEFLAQRGCFVVQGYFYAKPLPAAAFFELARTGLVAPQVPTQLADISG
jgi:diguanylate cyclase (GGDEF)-like protein